MCGVLNNQLNQYMYHYESLLIVGVRFAMGNLPQLSINLKSLEKMLQMVSASIMALSVCALTALTAFSNLFQLRLDNPKKGFSAEKIATVIRFCLIHNWLPLQGHTFDQS